MLQRAPEQTRARAQRPSTSTSAPTAPPVRTLTRTPSRSRAWRSNGDHAHTHTTPRTRWTHLPGLREAHAHPRKHTCTSDLTRSHHPCSPRMLACAHAPTCSHTDTRKRTHTARNARRPHNFPAVLPDGRNARSRPGELRARKRKAQPDRPQHGGQDGPVARLENRVAKPLQRTHSDLIFAPRRRQLLTWKKRGR